MSFNNITKDTTCNCLDGTAEDLNSTFARVLNKEAVTDNDFSSKWDKNHRHTDCPKICGLKGISVSKIENDEVKEEILTLYSQVFKMSPNYRRGVVLFKMKKGAGLVKHTPSNKNKYHHDLYKSDGFALNMIEESETCYLKTAVV